MQFIWKNGGYVTIIIFKFLWNDFTGVKKHLVSFFCLYRDENQSIVNVLLSRREDFRVFDTYISEYDRSMSLLEESCRDNLAFASIVKKFEVHKEKGKAKPRSL